MEIHRLPHRQYPPLGGMSAFPPVRTPTHPKRNRAEERLVEGWNPCSSCPKGGGLEQVTSKAHRHANRIYRHWHLRNVPWPHVKEVLPKSAALLI